MQPNTIFSGTTGPRGDRPGPDKLLVRAAMYLAITVFAPVASFTYGIWLALFTYARLPWWAPAAVAAPFAAIGRVTDRMGVNAITDCLLPLGTVLGYPEGPGAWLKDNLFTLLGAQFFLAFVIASIWATLVAGWKWIRRPKWEHRKLTPGPFLRKREKQTIEQIASSQNGPDDGVTVGVAIDRRDPRFAGGKPGAAYGERVVLKDVEGAGHCLVTGGTGAGKSLDVDTPIPTPRGFVRMGDLAVGDFVFGSDGRPVQVTQAHDVRYDRECFEVVFSDGSVIVADAEHLWTVHTANGRKSINRGRQERQRQPRGSEDEVARVRSALAFTPGDRLVTSSDLIALLDGGESRTVSLVHAALRDLPAAGRMQVGPFPHHYEGKTVMKTRVARAWRADEAYATLLGRLGGYRNDQRHRAMTAPVTLTTAQISRTFEDETGRRTYSIPVAPAVQYEAQELPLDPYVLGLWLGDGATSTGRFTTADPELVDAFISAGFTVNHVVGYDYYVQGLRQVLQRAGTFRIKRIPEQYLRSSEAQRRALLAGLMDTDGTHERGPRVSLTSGNELLALQVRELAAGLGYRPTIGTRMVTDQDGTVRGPYWTVSWSTFEPVFRLSRKASRHAASLGTARPASHGQRYIVDVRPVASRPVRCIAVDAADHLFLAGETYIPTHNTTTMLIGMRDVIRRGHGLIVVDNKGGPDVPEQLAEWAARYGRVFHHWSIQDPRFEYTGPADGPAFYDPISRGDASRRKDLLIGSQKWDVEYYKTVIGDYLQTMFLVSDLVPPAEDVHTFKDVADLLDPDTLVHRATNIPRELFPELMVALHRIRNFGPQEKSGIANMYARLNTLTSSTAGAWLRKDPNGTHDIDLLKAADEGHVVVFSLDTSNYEETAILLAGLIVQDLKTVSSDLRQHPAPAPLHVYIDEFSAVDTTNILGLLARARDAQMPVTLSTQVLADLKRREPQFVEQVLGVVSSFMIHRANTEEDARVFAGVSGLTKKMIHRINVEGSSGTLGTLGASSATGGGFLEETEEYRVEPGEFQALKQGQCVFIAKMPEHRYVSPTQVIREDAAKAELVGQGPEQLDEATRPAPVKVHRETYPRPNTGAYEPVVAEKYAAAPLVSPNAGVAMPTVDGANPLPADMSAYAPPGAPVAGAPVPGVPMPPPMPPAPPAGPRRPMGRPDEWGGI